MAHLGLFFALSSSALPRDRPRTPKELIQRSLALGCVTHTFHSARQGTSVVGATELGLDVPYSVSTGITVFSTIALGGGVQYFLRVFVAVNKDSTPRRASTRGSPLAAPIEASTSSVEVLAETLLGVDNSSPRQRSLLQRLRQQPQRAPAPHRVRARGRHRSRSRSRSRSRREWWRICDFVSYWRHLLHSTINGGKWCNPHGWVCVLYSQGLSVCFGRGWRRVDGVPN